MSSNPETRALAAPGAAAMIENRTFDEVAVGDSAVSLRTVTREDIELFAVVSGDVNPAHLDAAYAETTAFHHVIAHGMLGAALISSVLGVKLPGPGSIYLGQDLRFLRPVSIGDVIASTVTVKEKRPEKGDLVLDCRCVNQRGEAVIVGDAHVRAPRKKVRRATIELPEVRLARHERFHALMEAVGGLAPRKAAVAYPGDAAALKAVATAAAAGLIEPILVGPRDLLARAAEEGEVDLSAFRSVEASREQAAAVCVALVRAGEAALLMNGSLRAEEALRAALAKGVGLAAERRLSHAYLMDVPAYARPLLLTDAAVNVAPSLDDKRDIVQNAIDLARMLGLAMPRVALLSAVEAVTPALRSSLDAAALCKMADRGQISGGLVDGPLAFDAAVSPQAAASRGLDSGVAGQADILVAPDLESATMLAKQLTFLAGADCAGVVLGARAPIVLAGAADGERARLASCALAVLIAARQAEA